MSNIPLIWGKYPGWTVQGKDLEGESETYDDDVWEEGKDARLSSSHYITGVTLATLGKDLRSPLRCGTFLRDTPCK